jgi:hypothetical protein
MHARRRLERPQALPKSGYILLQLRTKNQKTRERETKNKQNETQTKKHDLEPLNPEPQNQKSQKSDQVP